MHIDAIILAGGSGKRFWPKGRQKAPKYLLKVDGSHSLLYSTIKRAMLLSPQKIVIITDKEYEKEVNVEVQKVKRSDEYLKLVEKHDLVFIVIKEPFNNDTALAVATGTYILNNDENQNIVAMFPSDQVITNDKPFVQAVKSAYSVAKKGYIATLGIAPDKPSTYFDYIETQNLKGKKWYTIKSYKERPDAETAKRYCNNENYYFNSRILIFRPSDMINEMKRYMPELTLKMQKVAKTKVTDPSFNKVLTNAYKNLKPLSIDYCILEKSKNVVVVPTSFNWSDMQTWGCLYDALEKDDDEILSMEKWST